MKKTNQKLQLKKSTIRVLRDSELTTINGGTCLEPTLVGTLCVAVAARAAEEK